MDPLAKGVPFGSRSPRKRGPYSTPINNSDLILELYGPEAGAHARSSIGMAIPLDAPVNCEAEVEIDG